MVSKIVLYRFRSEACGNYLATNQEWAAEAFAKLKDLIPQLTLVETGINFNKLDWACDFSVTFELTSWAAIETLLQQPQVKEAFDFAEKVSYEKRQLDFFF
ncbi:MAG: Dabb family protein [Candidatus Cloacimonetes bacterium]|nr:Dabb family protein [Candidatus Cloacimonadota bacterium]